MGGDSVNGFESAAVAVVRDRVHQDERQRAFRVADRANRVGEFHVGVHAVNVPVIRKRFVAGLGNPCELPSAVFSQRGNNVGIGQCGDRKKHTLDFPLL